MFLKPTFPKEIEEIILKLSKKKSTGPNSIPVRILKDHSTLLSEPLSLIINLSFEKGIFPNMCKIAQVIPVFKKGDSSICTNYRPISLLSVFSKIFEKCFYSHLYSFLSSNSLFLTNNSISEINIYKSCVGKFN